MWGFFVLFFLSYLRVTTRPGLSPFVGVAPNFSFSGGVFCFCFLYLCEHAVVYSSCRHITCAMCPPPCLLCEELWCYTLPYSNNCFINLHNTGGKNNTIVHENPNYTNNNTNSITNNYNDA